MKDRYKKIIKLAVNFVSICSLFYLSGCATLDRSECEVANWELIGFEDGAAGKPSSTVGLHRSACAEYTISPDLNAYLKGHKRGVQAYCTYQNGFDLGKRGYDLTDVCSEVNPKQFNSGYQNGKKHYLIISQMDQIKSEMQNNQKHLNYLLSDIKLNEEKIISSSTSPELRRKLLETNKGLNRDVELTRQNLFDQRSNLLELEEKYAKLSI